MSKLIIKDKYDKEKYIDATGDIIIAKGGDGTILRAINKFSYLKKPFFGVAAGTVNFLMNKEAEICSDAIYQKCRLIKAKVKYIKRSKNGKVEKYETKTFQAFNEVMISSKAGMNSWVNFHIEDKADIFGTFKGGGLIISTPQGSTGINKNAFGSVISPEENLWSILGDKTERRINHVLKPQKLFIHATSQSPIVVWIDGSCDIIQDVVEVTLSKGKTVTVIFNDDEEFKEKRRV